MSSGRAVVSGSCTVHPDEVVAIGQFPEEKNAVYKLTWTGDAVGINHYTASIGETLNYATHIEQLKKLGFYEEFEGFEG